MIDPTKKSARSLLAAGKSTESSRNDATDRPFDFIEEEGLTALLCEQNPLASKTIENALHLMDYQITFPENARDALKRMRYHVYDLIVVNENFDTRNPESNGVLIYLERLSMSVRRKIFVAMISSRYRTMDNMMAFHASVNLIVNIKNIEDIGKILSRGITDTEMFYSVYKEILKETGRV
jgi:CheY-like chemotaxis protein